MSLSPIDNDMVLLMEVMRIKLLVAEAMEIAIGLFNDLKAPFGKSKILDIFDQIFPTAFVMNTAYWVFYTSGQGYSPCICHRFGIRCRHERNWGHWLNMAPVAEVDETTVVSFWSPQSYLRISNFYSEVAKTHQYYNILVRFVLHVDHGVAGCEIRHICFACRYVFTPQLYISETPAVIFNPSPKCIPTYGQMLPTILRGMFGMATRVLYAMPNYTYMLDNDQIIVPLPLFHPPNLAIEEGPDILEPTVNQTQVNNEAEIQNRVPCACCINCPASTFVPLNEPSTSGVQFEQQEFTVKPEPYFSTGTEYIQDNPQMFYEDVTRYSSTVNELPQQSGSQYQEGIAISVKSEITYYQEGAQAGPSTSSNVNPSFANFSVVNELYGDLQRRDDDDSPVYCIL